MSRELLPMLERNRALWRGHAAHCYADSGSRAGQRLAGLAAEGFHYTVSYNQWTGPLERLAEGLPDLAWTKGEGEDYALGSHTPSGLGAAHRFVIVRRRDELLVRHGFVAGDDG